MREDRSLPGAPGRRSGASHRTGSTMMFDVFELGPPKHRGWVGGSAQGCRNHTEQPRAHLRRKGVTAGKCQLGVAATGGGQAVEGPSEATAEGSPGDDRCALCELVDRLASPPTSTCSAVTW